MNIGCLILCELVVFLMIAPCFLGPNSMTVVASILSLLGFAVCIANINCVLHKKSAAPFIGGLLLFFGILSFPTNQFGTSFFYYAKMNVYLFVLFDVSYPMALVTICMVVYGRLRRLARWIVPKSSPNVESAPESDTLEDPQE